MKVSLNPLSTNVFEVVWGIKLKKVDLSWPAVFSSSQNPSWIELNLSFKPWIELTRALHFWPKVELSCPIIYSSSYNPSWIELNQVNSSQLKAKLKNTNLITWYYSGQHFFSQSPFYVLNEHFTMLFYYMKKSAHSSPQSSNGALLYDLLSQLVQKLESVKVRSYIFT